MSLDLTVAVCCAVSSTICLLVLLLSVHMGMNIKQKMLPAQFDVEIEAGVMIKPLFSSYESPPGVFLCCFLFLICPCFTIPIYCSLVCSSFTGSASSKFVLYIFSPL